MTSIREAIPPLAILLLAAVAAYLISAIPTHGVADASTSDTISIPYPPGEARAPALKPIEMPPDVVARAETPSPEVALWRTGAPLAVILAALAGALIFVAHFDGKRALKWTSLAGAVLVAADAAHGGQAPTVSMLITAIAVLGGISLPGVLQQRIVVREHQRAPTERGAGAGPLLAILAGAAVVLGAAYLASCSPVRQHARDTAGAVVDCTTETARAHATEYGTLLEQVLRAATAPDGSIDPEPLKAAAATFGLETGACSLATVIARAMSVDEPQGLLAAPGPSRAERLREAWEAVRAERFGGARFRVEGGAVL